AGGEGGGIWSANSGTTTIQSCTISGNSAGGNGGGILCLTAPDITTSILNCTISGNQGNEGGGISATDLGQTRITIENSIVAGNLSSQETPDLRFTAGVYTVRFSLIGDK